MRQLRLCVYDCVHCVQVCSVFERCRSPCIPCLNGTVNLADFLRCDRLCFTIHSLFVLSVILWYVKAPYLYVLSLLGLFPEVHSLSKHTHTNQHRATTCISHKTINSAVSLAWTQGACLGALLDGLFEVGAEDGSLVFPAYLLPFIPVLHRWNKFTACQENC